MTMTTDAIDITLIFAFVICVIAICAISGMRTAYRAGYWAGKRHGILWEKRRRRRVEERVEEKIAETFESVKWERDLNV